MGIYDVLNSAPGWTECEIRGAQPAAFLNACAAGGLTLLAVWPADAYTLRVLLAPRDAARARQLALRTQCAFAVLASGGAPKLRRILLRRIVPALCILAALAGLVWSRLFLWDIRVTGNERVPTAAILDALRECGVDCGSFWPAFTSDGIRSALLLELPELAWATVNVYGSRAEVIVRERVPKPEIFDPGVPMDVLAAKSGFLTKLQVLRGAPQVKRGSAVMAGDTLISGAVGSKFSGTYFVHAVGTAEAETYSVLLAKTPAETLQKTYTGKQTERWALQLGKNRYNFYGNSSISGNTCDKIKSVWNLEIRGLFRLPVSLIRETEREYTLTPRRTDARAAAAQMEQELYAALLRGLGADGAVEAHSFSRGEADGCIVVCLRARCSENIAAEAPMPQEKLQRMKEEAQ